MSFKTAEIFASVDENITDILLDNYSLIKNMQIELYNILNTEKVNKKIVSFSMNNSLPKLSDLYFYDLHNLLSKSKTSSFIKPEHKFNLLKLFSYSFDESNDKPIILYNIDITFPLNLMKKIPLNLINSGLLLNNINNISEARLILLDQTFLEEDLEFFQNFDSNLIKNLKINEIDFSHNYSDLTHLYRLGTN